MTEAAVKDFYLSINGSPATAAMAAAIREMVAESTLNQPSMALITLYDPGLIYADDTRLAPGKLLKIEVETGTSGKATVFDGEIVEVELDMRDDVAYTLVRAFDKMHRLSRGTTAKTFLNVKDSDVVSTLASAKGLTANVTATRQVYPYILQQAESDLSLIRRLAARNGYAIGFRDGKFEFKPLQSTGSAKTLTWGQNLREFRPRMAGSTQLSKVNVRSWDVKKKAAIIGQASSGAKVTPKIGETITSWSLPKVEMVVADVTLPTQAAAEAMATGYMNRSASLMVHAEGVAAGDATLIAGASVKVAKVGTRFAGTYIVTRAHHRITPQDGYSVTFTVAGLVGDSLAYEMLFDDLPPATFHGLMPAVVTNVEDPDDLGRVKVKLPWLGDQIESDWARVVVPGGGATRGIQFMPEVNDEVLVGFLQGSGDQLFVLGGMWNGTDKPARAKAKFFKSGKIIERVLRTREGHEILLSDDTEQGGIVITDKNGNEISIKAKDGLLTIKAKGNITITSDKDISLTAKGKLTLSSTEDMALSSKAKLELSSQTEGSLKVAGGKAVIEGVNVEIKGKAGAAIDGGAKFEIKGATGNINGSGILELKGGVIKLN